MKAKSVFAIVGLFLAFAGICATLYPEKFRTFLGIRDDSVSPPVSQNESAFQNDVDNDNMETSNSSSETTVQVTTPSKAKDQSKPEYSQEERKITTDAAIKESSDGSTNGAEGRDVNKDIKLNNYINVPPNLIDYSIFILNENNLLDKNLTNRIAQLYNQQSSTTSTSLFTKEFFNSTEISKIINGNYDYLAKINISKHTKYLIFGTISENQSKGKLANDTYVLNVSLSGKIISTNSFNEIKHIEINDVRSNGSSFNLAKEFAYAKIISLYQGSYMED